MNNATTRSAAITGIGVVSPIGIEFEKLAEGLAAGASGIDWITNFDAEELPVKRAGEALDFDLTNHIASVKTYIDRTSAFALAAAAMALNDSGWIGNIPGADIGLCFGSAWGCQDSIELFTQKLVESNPKFAPPLVFTHGYANAPNSLVSIEFGLRGHNTCFAGGATAGASAVASALTLLRENPTDRLLAGAADALSEVAVQTIISSGQAASDICRPFDAAADGLLPGEAAGILALESAAGAAERDAEILGHLLSVGTGGGATPAQALQNAIRYALADADIQADDIDAVFSSASGVPELDAAEAQAIASLPGRPPVVALKSIVGDPLGAWMPFAIAAALGCIDEETLPAIHNLENPISSGINIVREPLQIKPRTCLILNLDRANYASAAIISGPSK